MHNLWVLLFLCFLQGDNDELIVQEKFRVDFVRLDILALDKQGNPVTDLKASDFIVKEGRKSINLEYFEPFDYRQAFEATGVEVLSDLPNLEKVDAEANPRPQYIFSVDLESVPLVEMRKTFSQLRKALEQSDFPQQADYLLYSMESGVLTDGFVPSFKSLIYTVNQFEDRMSDRYEHEINNRGSSNHQAVKGSGRASTGPRDLRGLESAIETCLLLSGTSTTSPHDRMRAGRSSGNNRQAVLDCVADAVEAYVEQEELRVMRVIGELESLTLRFQDRLGLKTLFFISPGFSLQPGKEAAPMASTIVREELRNREGYAFDFLHFPNSMEDEFRRVSHACIRNRVVFHTLDIYSNAKLVSDPYLSGGRRSTSGFYARVVDSYSQGLSTLATESGGFHLRAPSLSKSLNKVIPRLKFHYLIGYASPDGKPGKYRKIKIKCKRKGVKLHYRRGYFGKS